MNNNSTSIFDRSDQTNENKHIWKVNKKERSGKNMQTKVADLQATMGKSSGLVYPY